MTSASASSFRWRIQTSSVHSFCAAHTPAPHAGRPGLLTAYPQQSVTGMRCWAWWVAFLQVLAMTASGRQGWGYGLGLGVG